MKGPPKLFGWVVAAEGTMPPAVVTSPLSGRPVIFTAENAARDFARRLTSPHVVVSGTAGLALLDFNVLCDFLLDPEIARRG